MPVVPGPHHPHDRLLVTDAGTPLARFGLLDDEGDPVASRFRPFRDASPAEIASLVRSDLTGHRLETPDPDVVAALQATGLEPTRSATELRHDLDSIPAARLPDGWTLAGGGWDDDLATALRQAYAGHPDGEWDADADAAIAGLWSAGAPVPPLATACARVVRPDGRSAGHVVVSGPVPWTEDVCSWGLSTGVAPDVQGLGLGRALLAHALQGTRDAGLPSLRLSVVDGNDAAHRLYARAGFVHHERVLTVQIP